PVLRRILEHLGEIQRFFRHAVLLGRCVLGGPNRPRRRFSIVQPRARSGAQPVSARIASSSAPPPAAARRSRSTPSDFAWYFCTSCVNDRPRISTVKRSSPAASARAFASDQ